jgi:hypothetical protein
VGFVLDNLTLGQVSPSTLVSHTNFIPLIVSQSSPSAAGKVSPIEGDEASPPHPINKKEAREFPGQEAN